MQMSARMLVLAVYSILAVWLVVFCCDLGGSKSLFSFKSQIRTEPYKPVKSQEAIQLAKLPDAQPVDKGHMRPIERDDWPSPPAPAAAFPELCTLSNLLIVFPAVFSLA